MKALYGTQTKLAVKNFPISGWQMPPEIIQALALIKKHVAHAYASRKKIDTVRAKAIAKAADSIWKGKHSDQFPVDVFQTGSGTSTNMNLNEVIASLASTKTRKVHPNDHVNIGQSSNDTVPSAVQIACALAVRDKLLPAMKQLHTSLKKQATRHKKIVKTARTHLMDAVPVTLGEELAAFANLLNEAEKEVQRALTALCQLPLGGTAAGTGLNADAVATKKAIEAMAKETSLALREAKNHIAAQSCPLALQQLSGALQLTATALKKMADDIRWMSSGPVAGLHELELPSLQKGSSIMPGKVNPVLCESVLQVVWYIDGVDASVRSMLREGAQFELCMGYPLAGYQLLSGINMMSNAINVFATKCIDGLKANEELMKKRHERNAMLATKLAPHIGYEKAAKIAKEAMKKGETIVEVAVRRTGISKRTIMKILEC